MVDMTLNESMERFREGIKKAASRSRELGILQKNSNWTKIAFQLEKLLHNGNKLYSGHAISRGEALKILDSRENVMNRDLNG